MKTFEISQNTPIAQQNENNQNSSEVVMTPQTEIIEELNPTDSPEQLAPPPNHIGRRENQERLAPPANQNGGQPMPLQEENGRTNGGQPTLLREQPSPVNEPSRPPVHTQPGSRSTPPPNQNGTQPTLFQEERPVNDPSRPAPHTQTGGRPTPPPDSQEEPPPHPLDGTPLPNVWVYEGEAYDLSDFITKHPGGQFFIGRTKNRDITTIVNIFHRNPEKVKKMLKKYALGRQARPEDVHPKYNAPAFLFYEGFDGWRDTPMYNFQNKDQLMNRVKKRLEEPEMKERVARMDSWFNFVSAILAISYVLIQVLRLEFTQYMPLYVFIPLMAMIRISLSGVGHYLIHRPQVRWNKFMANVFDINYVPMALVVTDGHSLLHHPFTQSEVDIKKNVFTFMLELPRYYRVPIHTIHKIGHVVTGMFARSIEIVVLGIKAGVKDMYGSWPRAFPHFAGNLGMRVLLAGEFILFWTHGDLIAWLGQFFITLWISTFMIVASHDFEEEAKETNVTSDDDWAVQQIKNSYDLTMIGNKYVDCFLSAGLSPHRVHHVLPFQKSGFANIISEDIVREEAAKFDVEWVAPKNFFVDRMPILIDHYLGVPSRLAQEKNFGLLKEHFHPKALMITADYIIKGFAGIGSV